MSQTDVTEKIIELIIHDSTTTTSHMAKTLGKDRRTIARHIKKMQEAGLIRRVGPDFGGHWEIIK